MMARSTLERIPLTPEKPTFIDDIVKDAQLVERIGKIDVSIMRPTGPNLPPCRMDVDFDAKGKHVMVDQNYSLRAGDTSSYARIPSPFSIASCRERPCTRSSVGPYIANQLDRLYS